MKNLSTARGLTLVSGSGGSGRTAAGLGIAAAQARRGRKVLFVDLCFGWGGLNIQIGNIPEYRDIFLKERNFSELTSPTAGGFDILTCTPPDVFNLNEKDLEHISKCLSGLSSGYDLIILDPPSGAHPLALLSAGLCEDVLLMIKPEASSVASAYCLLKNLIAEKIGSRIAAVFSFVDSPEQAVSFKARFDSLTEKFLKISVADGGYTYRWTDNERDEFFVGQDLRETKEFAKHIRAGDFESLQDETSIAVADAINPDSVESGRYKIG